MAYLPEPPFDSDEWDIWADMRTLEMEVHVEQLKKVGGLAVFRDWSDTHFLGRGVDWPISDVSQYEGLWS